MKYSIFIYLFFYSFFALAQNFEVIKGASFDIGENTGVEQYENGWAVADDNDIYLIDFEGNIVNSYNMTDTINSLTDSYAFTTQLIGNGTDFTLITRTKYHIIFTTFDEIAIQSINAHNIENYHTTKDFCTAPLIEMGNGNFYFSTVNYDSIYLHQLDNIGNVNWTNSYAKKPIAWEIYAPYFVAEENGDVYIARIQTVNHYANSIRLDKISVVGDTLWSYVNDLEDELSSIGFDIIEQVKTLRKDNNGDLLMSANFYNNEIENWDLFLGKFDTETGTVINENTYDVEGIEQNDNMWFNHAFAIDSENNFYGFEAKNNFTISKLLKITPLGNIEWEVSFYNTAFEGNAEFSAHLCDLNQLNRNNTAFCLDSNNNIFVVRKLSNEYTLQLQKYNSSGELMYSGFIEDSNTNTIGNSVLAIEINEYDEILLLNRYNSEGQVLIIKDLVSVNTDELSDKDLIKVYPNPTSSQLIIDVANFQDFTEMTIFNSFGEIVKRLNLNQISKRLDLDIEQWANGIYYLQLKNKEKDAVKIINWIKQ